MNHSLSFSAWVDPKNITTECLFQCSCREWRIEIPLPAVTMKTLDQPQLAIQLVRMGMDVGRQFEREHIQEISA